jgi:hypothetical protein
MFYDQTGVQNLTKVRVVTRQMSPSKLNYSKYQRMLAMALNWLKPV